MRDTNLRNESILLTSLAKAAERLLDAGHRLSQRCRPVAVSVDLQPRHYRTGPTIEGWVDVQTKDSSIAWTLDITWDDSQLQIQSDVRSDSCEPQAILFAFPTRIATSSTEFARELDATISDIVNSIDSGKFI